MEIEIISLVVDGRKKCRRNGSFKGRYRVKETKSYRVEQVNELLEDPIINTYYEGKYTNENRQTIMELVSECRVSQKKVNQVLDIVAKKLYRKVSRTSP